MRHFLSRIQALRMICEKSNKKIAFLPNPVLDDLLLCNKFLHWAKNGISMNLVSSRYPSIFLRSDACEYGRGVYNIYTGHAWRLKLPPDCSERAHINTLEFIASTISIWIEIYNKSIQKLDCILSQQIAPWQPGGLRNQIFLIHYILLNHQVN